MADTPSPHRNLEDPRLLPFLPLLYLAWADGDLAPEEIREISRQLEAQDGLNRECRDLFHRWLDPAEPPTVGQLLRLLSTVRRAAADIPEKERRSLSELGAGLLEAHGHEASEAELRALRELEQALGFRGSEATRRVLSQERPEPAAEKVEPPFSVDTLIQLLDGDHHPLRQRVRELLCRPVFAYRYGDPKEVYRERTLERLKALATEGFGSLSFPEEYGGSGDPRSFVTVFETLAYGDLSLLVKFGVQFGLFGGSIFQLGTEEHHRRYLADASTAEHPGCFAMSEAGHGSNVRDVETTATYDPASEEFVVHTPTATARKDWIGNAALHGRLATVFAQLEISGREDEPEGEGELGVHAFLVPIRDEDGRPLPGVRIEDCGEKLGLNGVDNGRLWFERVRIPRENLLDRFAQVAADGTYSSPIPSPAKRFFTMLGTLVGGRVSVALASCSVAKSGLTIAVRYGHRRRQFGPAGQPEVRILDYLTHQRRLLPRLARTYALHFALQELAQAYTDSEDEGDRRAVETQAAGLKAYASWHAVDTLQICRECCGGQGYLAVNRFASLKADTDVFTTFEGDNVVLLQLVAKGLLSGYRRQFSDLNLLGIARYLAGQAATNLAELNPLVTRRTDEDHLRDRSFQQSALAWREQHLLSSAARRLKKRIDDGMDSHQALIDCQDHLLKLALAHVERVVLDSFAQAVEACEDEAVAKVLSDLCDLYALERIEADRGWFLSQHYVEPGKSKAIRNLVNRLCRDLRPVAVPLVNAFAIPDEVLAAPIALGDLEKPVAEEQSG